MRQSRNLLIAVFTLFTLASATAKSGPSPSASTEIRNMLQVSFADYELQNDTKVFITFMLTDENKIIVLSTNNESFDGLVKSTLNYKQISSENLTKGKTYTLPLVLENK